MAKKYRPKILLLGSGHLLEFPEEILDLADWSLVDAVHPWHIRIRSFYQPIKIYFADLAKPAIEILQATPIFQNKWDAVISCNLISQLMLEVTDESKRPMLLEHLKLLKSISDQILLLSDFSLQSRDSSGEIIERHSTLPSFTEPKRSWKWNLSPDDSSNQGIELEVGIWREEAVRSFVEQNLN